MNLKRYVFRTIISVAFIVSILFNLFYLIDLSNRPTYQLGVLAQDVSVADFYNDSKVLFILPKDLTIMDASPRGIAAAGLFGRSRFTFTVMESGWHRDGPLVDYSPIPPESRRKALYNGTAAQKTVP
jgi:hypothetical protein